MRTRAYCAHPSIRDHWVLRCMSRCPDQLVSLKRDPQCLSPQASLIVRVHYFVRGGFVRHRSRAGSKHLSPHLPVGELDSSGGQTGVALHLQMHVWVSVYKETDQMLLFSRSDVTMVLNFKLRTGQGRFSLSSLPWVDKQVH
ncbi:hypothetical protein TNCV_1319681 [Trichonephila clavipes]|nr:hypothetical protein TNCV_1319681 [Trichonephila clavipes]